MPVAVPRAVRAGAVDVVLHRLRRIEVDDVAHAGDVEAAGGDVGRHQDAVLTFAEALEGLHALSLRQVRVDALDRMTPRAPARARATRRPSCGG